MKHKSSELQNQLRLKRTLGLQHRSKHWLLPIFPTWDVSNKGCLTLKKMSGTKRRTSHVIIEENVRQRTKYLLAPGRKRPLISKIVKIIYGAVAVTQTTFPEDLTPLNREKYNMTKTTKQQPTSSGLREPMSVNPEDLLICKTRRLKKC